MGGHQSPLCSPDCCLPLPDNSPPLPPPVTLPSLYRTSLRLMGRIRIDGSGGSGVTMRGAILSVGGGAGAPTLVWIGWWLAAGCITPRQVWQRVCTASATPGFVHGSGSGSISISGYVPDVGNTPAFGATWMALELMWRDFFRFHLTIDLNLGCGR